MASYLLRLYSEGRVSEENHEKAMHAAAELAGLSAQIAGESQARRESERVQDEAESGEPKPTIEVPLTAAEMAAQEKERVFAGIHRGHIISPDTARYLTPEEAERAVLVDGASAECRDREEKEKRTTPKIEVNLEIIGAPKTSEQLREIVKALKDTEEKRAAAAVFVNLKCRACRAPVRISSCDHCSGKGCDACYKRGVVPHCTRQHNLLRWQDVLFIRPEAKKEPEPFKPDSTRHMKPRPSWVLPVPERVQCVYCEQLYMPNRLLENRCIDCWKRIADYFKRRDEQHWSLSEANSKGYMAAHDLIVEQLELDIRLLKNPYDMQKQPGEYGEWRRGRDARLGAYFLFLWEQRGDLQALVQEMAQRHRAAKKGEVSVPIGLDVAKPHNPDPAAYEGWNASCRADGSFVRVLRHDKCQGRGCIHCYGGVRFWCGKEQRFIDTSGVVWRPVAAASTEKQQEESAPGKYPPGRTQRAAENAYQY